MNFYRNNHLQNKVLPLISVCMVRFKGYILTTIKLDCEDRVQAKKSIGENHLCITN